MTDIIKGKVGEVKSRETSIGTMYDIVVNGTTYGAGKYEPRVKAGQYVKFPVKYNGKYANVSGKIVTIAEEEAGNPAAVQRASSDGPRSYGGYNDEKRQEVISRQAARNTAVAFMQILASKDALPMPASAKTPAARFDVLSTLLDGLTARFNAFALGREEPSAVEETDDAEDEGDDGDFR